MLILIRDWLHFLYNQVNKFFESYPGYLLAQGLLDLQILD